MSDIKCQVEECYYNENYMCGASSIKVRSSVTNNVVNNTDDTACETFVPKEEYR
ncbi:DUF1540 domain-containing protein [Natranaerobius thermophilus]|uniref:DUF1540 domain-containing protein n=1 Tax=Natranaerobius thermophilus (strain ATCC BAA-1301 / DSM 18059 / JW/NM-WN-LF) TaxID=457570 RepID=B2A870_NATTJ|nr:DUF1540 domain-containing protein [Natranaerobius thermophilus]ACB84436.1 protein of unknown function DUF1540 [Natranaerobius thermophilus JW/NM-WN-LF]